MAVQVALAGMRRVNYRVHECCYASDVVVDGLTTVDMPAMPAASPNAIMNAVSIASAGTAAPNAVGYGPGVFGRYGRNITVVASGAATGNVAISGYDYLGQGVKENFALNGTTPVVGKKIFADVVSATYPAAAGVTLNVGTGNKLGVPFKALGTQMMHELINDATPTAGALTPGVNTQTLTSDDPRGSYTPTLAPDGARYYRFTYAADRSNLHGNAHVSA